MWSSVMSAGMSIGMTARTESWIKRKMLEGWRNIPEPDLPLTHAEWPAIVFYIVWILGAFLVCYALYQLVKNRWVD